VNRPGGYEQLFAGLRVVHFTSYLKFHPAFEYDHNLISCVREVFPARPRRIGPQAAIKAARRPPEFDRFLIDFHSHRRRVSESLPVTSSSAGNAFAPRNI
jgi:hypothetical protein